MLPAELLMRMCDCLDTELVKTPLFHTILLSYMYTPNVAHCGTLANTSLYVQSCVSFHMSKHSEVLEIICTVYALTLPQTFTKAQVHKLRKTQSSYSSVSLSADFSPLNFSPWFHLSTVFLFVSSISSISHPRPPFSIYAVFSVSWVTYTESKREWDLPL